MILFDYVSRWILFGLDLDLPVTGVVVPVLKPQLIRILTSERSYCIERVTMPITLHTTSVIGDRWLVPTSIELIGKMS